MSLKRQLILQLLELGYFLIYAHWMKILNCSIQTAFRLSRDFFCLYDVSPNKKVNVSFFSCGSIITHCMEHLLVPQLSAGHDVYVIPLNLPVMVSPHFLGGLREVE